MSCHRFINQNLMTPSGLGEKIESCLCALWDFIQSDSDYWNVIHNEDTICALEDSCRR